MAGTTIATKTKIAVRLTAASQLPLTVTATGAINVASGNAVYVAAPLSGVITNLGVIKTLGGDRRAGARRGQCRQRQHGRAPRR